MGDLVEPGSATPRIGEWPHALAEPNLEDAEIAHALAPVGKWRGLGRVEAAYRQRFRLKSWQYMTAVTDELFVAFIVGTAGFAGNGFVYAVERGTRHVHQRFAITPLAAGARLAPSSAAGAHRFRGRGLAIEIANLDGGRRFDVRLEGRTTAATELVAELAFTSAPRDQHLVQCVPLPGGRWSYTHKLAGFGVAGHLTIGGRRFAFAPEGAFGTLDFTKQYALRHAVWRWIALCGRSRQGALIGLNLVDPTPDAPISENALWIDGAREPLADVILIPHADDGAAPWRVEAETVDLEMTPLAHVEQRMDVPLVRHRLRHAVGAFSGRVRTASGHVHDLDALVGIAEDNDTWW